MVANSKVSVSYRREKRALLEEDFPAHRGCREMILNHIAQHTLGLPRVVLVDRSLVRMLLSGRLRAFAVVGGAQGDNASPAASRHHPWFPVR